MNPAFFTIHSDLPREGPGLDDDVHWAMDLIGVAGDARVLDAGCGPGGDIAALLSHIPHGHLTAVDPHAPFIDTVTSRFEDTPRLTPRAIGMEDATGPFDVIWSAGALYFLGGAAALDRLRPALAPGGAIAFSEPCFFTDTPSRTARGFWEGEDAAIRTVDEILDITRAKGFDVVGHRNLTDAAWEAYFGPIETRLAELKSGMVGRADQADLADAIAAQEREIAGWRAAKTETGYVLVVARATR